MIPAMTNQVLANLVRDFTRHPKLPHGSQDLSYRRLIVAVQHRVMNRPSSAQPSST